MTTTEIKKAWAAMSRKLKKTGMNYTCVMNAKPFADQLASEPVKAFMEATGAKVHLENVPDGYYTKVYARFSY